MNDLDPKLLGPLPDLSVPLVPVNNELEPADYVETDEGDEDDGDFEAVWADRDGEPIPDDPRSVSHETSLPRGVRISTQNITVLRNLGWRIRTTGEAVQAIKHFQEAVNLGVALKPDGVVGPLTQRELNKAEMRRKAGLPTASAHFSFTEFRCKCGGRFSNCARIWIKRAQIQSMEHYRRALGHGVSIVSGCRCPGHNSAVKGVRKSRHMLGDASDFTAERSPEWHRQHDDFNGLGYNRSDHKVRHGDQGGRRSWIYA